MRKLLVFFIAILLSVNYGYSQDIDNGFTDSLFSSNNNILTIHQDKRIAELVIKHIEANKQKVGMFGYRIQIYAGSGKRGRTEAQNKRKYFLINHPNVTTNIIYQEPNFKLRVGNFRTKAEGYKLYKKLLETFPNCYFIIDENMQFPKLD